MLQELLTALNPLNSMSTHPEVVFRQYCCPGRGSCFSTDAQLSDDDPRSPEMHLQL